MWRCYPNPNSNPNPNPTPNPNQVCGPEGETGDVVAIYRKLRGTKPDKDVKASTVQNGASSNPNLDPNSSTRARTGTLTPEP